MDAQLTMGLDEADLMLDGEDLAVDRGLATAVLVSLFSDGRADESDVLPGEDPRGWWAEGGERYGSLLWLLDRAKATQATAARAREFAEHALAWMLAEDIASAVEVEASYTAPRLLRLAVRIHRGTAPRWAHLWEDMAGFERQIGGLLLLLEVA